jgi:hypothetical protein
MEQGYMDAHDLRLPTLVDTVDEAVNLIFDTLKEFQIQRDQNPDPP